MESENLSVSENETILSESANKGSTISLLPDENDLLYSDSNPQDIRVISMHIEWNLNKEKPAIVGNVTLNVEQLNSNVTNLLLDSDAGLRIIAVEDGQTRQPLAYTEKGRSYMDNVLAINLAKSLNESRKCSLIIKYKMTKTDAIHYSKDKEDYPLMHSEFEYLRGRNLFPCQDTPTNKIMFSAVVRIDKNLQMLMSAKLIKTERPNQNMNKLYFNNPHPIPVYAIGFAMGKFQIHEIGDNVKIYTEKTITEKKKYLTYLQQIPTYIELINQLVGKDPWGEHHIALVSKSTHTSGYPYLYILPEADLSPEYILHSFSHNWFRSAITIRNINDIWLHEAFPAYVSRRLSAHVSGNNVEIENKIHTAATDYKNISLVFRTQNFSDTVSLQLLTEKAYLCLMILEHYGGKYGEFDTLLRFYFDKNKFKYADLETFTKAAENCLVFGKENEVCLISNIEEWIKNGAPVPEEFQMKITPFLEVEKIKKWLMENTEEKPVNGETKQRRIRRDAPPLLSLTPEYVNHRTKKLLLLEKLHSSEKGKLSTKIFHILGEELGLNCAKDETMKYEFIKLSIEHEQPAQLVAIKEFVANNSDTKQLIDIMQRMLLWEQDSIKINKPDEYNYTPMRQDIIRICDRILEQLISSEENEKRTSVKSKKH